MEGSLLRRADARLIVGAVGVSAVGDFLLWVPLTLRLQSMTDSGIAVAGVLIALWAPVVVLAPVAGLLVDRSEARRVLMLVSFAQAIVAAGLALALDSVAAILVLATLLGTGFAFAQPAEFALAPVIAGRERVNEMNSYVETARYAGMTLGPLLGGVLAAAGGTQVAMLVNAVSFLAVTVAAGLLTARRHPEAAPEDAEPERARDGIVFLVRERTLAVVMGVAFVSLLFMTASATAEVFFLKDVLEVGDVLYGLIFSGWTVGMVIGALVIARRVGSAALAAGALVAVGIQGIGLGLPTAWLVVPFGAAMWFIGGLAHGTKNVLVRTLIQERVPDRLHGRAFAAYNGLRNGAELFALARDGLLVAVIGARATLALAGGIPVLVALAGLIVHRRRGRPEPVSGEALPPEPEAAPGLLAQQ
jgi:MFS family permease